MTKQSWPNHDESNCILAIYGWNSVLVGGINVAVF